MPEANLRSAALQFSGADSPLHRMGIGWKLAIATAGAGLALALDSIWLLAGLFGIWIAGYRLARLSPADLWRDTRWLVIQGALIVGLTIAVSGATAASSGLRSALQISLIFLPGALVLRTTSSESLVDPLRRWLPDPLGFAAGATLRFVPFFTRELTELVQAQRLRGAKLKPEQLWRPSAWHDWGVCVVVPMAIRSVEVAQQASEAAEIRGLGRSNHSDPIGDPS